MAAKVLNVRHKSFPEAAAFTVLHVVLLADLSDYWSKLVEMAMVHTREQVMLHLKVKAPCEKIDQKAVDSDIVRCHNLMLKEVLVELLCSVWR